jgi:putative membrane protein
MDKDITSFAQSHQIDLTGATAAESKESASLGRLKSMQGAQADRAYMKMMVEGHTKDVKETKEAGQHAKAAKNTELAKLLDKSAKKMEDHLKDAQKIQRDLSQRQARTPSSQ